MSERQFASLRALQVTTVLLLLLSVGSDFYLGLKMSENSRVFDRIYALLESGMNEQLAGAMTQASALQKELAGLDQQIGATGLQVKDWDSRISQAEERMVARISRELPPVVEKELDRVLEARMAQWKESLAQETMRQQMREDLRKIIREEIARRESQGERN